MSTMCSDKELNVISDATDCAAIYYTVNALPPVINEPPNSP